MLSLHINHQLGNSYIFFEETLIGKGFILSDCCCYSILDSATLPNFARTGSLALLSASKLTPFLAVFFINLAILKSS